VWVERRTTKRGGVRYRVEYRVGGRESASRYAGTFGTMREARARRDWVAGELANMRVPDLTLLAEAKRAPLVREVAERWQASRVDVAENTRLQHRSAIRRMLPVLGGRHVDTVTPTDVADLVAALSAGGTARESIRKTLNAAAMIFDFAGIKPNPARDRVHVRLPHEVKQEINPPTAEHVLAVHQLLPARYRLPLLVLDATGMRVGELEALS